KVIWQHSLTEEYGRISGYGGRLTSPIVDGDLVIIGMLNASWGELARGGNRFVAFDKRTGHVVWWTETQLPPTATYASVPVVAVINDERLFITGGGDGAVHAFKVRTGEKVWSYSFSQGGVNIAPVVDGNFVYIGHGEENPDNNIRGRVVCLDASKVEKGEPKLVWKVDDIIAKFCSPIFHQGRLYICDDNGKMNCLDGKTGEEIWTVKYGRNSKGSPVLADGKIYVAEVNAKFHILKPEEKSCKKLYSQFFKATTPGHDIELNGSAAVANGRVYFSTSEEVICIGKKDAPSAKVA